MWTVIGDNVDKPELLTPEQYQKNPSGTVPSSADWHQDKHPVMPEQDRRRVEGSKHLQGPSTPDRGVDVPVILHPHTVTLAEQISSGAPLAAAIPSSVNATVTCHTASAPLLMPQRVKG